MHVLHWNLSILFISGEVSLNYSFIVEADDRRCEEGCARVNVFLLRNVFRSKEGMTLGSCCSRIDICSF